MLGRGKVFFLQIFVKIFEDFLGYVVLYKSVNKKHCGVSAADIQVTLYEVKAFVTSQGVFYFHKVVFIA